MAIALLPRIRTNAPSSIAPVSRETSIGRSIISLVQCGVQVTENVHGRIPSIKGDTGVPAPFIALPQGPARVWAGGVGSTGYGIGSLNRREWAEWDITAGPFTWFAYWQMNSAATSGTTYPIAGDLASGTGYGIHGFVGTRRRYFAGAAGVASASDWLIATPMVTVMTVDAGGVLTGYLNGAQDVAPTSGVGTISYGSFDRVFFGEPGTDGPSTGDNATGNIWYMGIANRAWTPDEIKLHALNPWMLFAAEPRTWFDFAVAASAGTWKTSLGLASSSIKTVDGLAKASIKTNLGLTP